MLRYRCRVGHAFSMESMEAEQADVLERAMWTAIRTLDEKADLMRRLKERTRDQNTPHALRRFEERQKEAEENADALRDMMRVMKETNPAND
jgi:two-component system chemotaxis response regulator CheB